MRNPCGCSLGAVFTERRPVENSWPQKSAGPEVRTRASELSGCRYGDLAVVGNIREHVVQRNELLPLLREGAEAGALRDREEEDRVPRLLVEVRRADGDPRVQEGEVQASSS